MKTAIKDVTNLLTAESAELEKLQAIVRKTMEDEQLIVSNLTNPPQECITYGQRISDRVARFGGSWMFIICFFLVLAAWIGYNSIMPKSNIWDPYPFILMNLVLSCIAAIQAPIIMMSQNRVEEKDRKRSENDYMINLKAELELRALHQKIDMLLEEQIKVLFQSQAKQLELLKAIDKKLNAKKPNSDASSSVVRK